MKRRILLSWSSGKDSAWTLHMLQRDPNNEVVALLTIINEKYERVAMHAVRKKLLEAQAKAAKIDLWQVEIPNKCVNEQYEDAMRKAMIRAKNAGVTTVAFGDLYLEDVRSYRESKMKQTGLNLLFPLWKTPIRKLAKQMQKGGLKTVVTCVDPNKLSPKFAGRDWNSDFVNDLPITVDPCGENGEFHTFVYDGPMFSEPIGIKVGKTVKRDGFVFADLNSVDS